MYLPIINLKMNLTTFGYYLVVLGFIGLYYRSKVKTKAKRD